MPADRSVWAALSGGPEGLESIVPATIFFFYFKNRANKYILMMEALTLDVIKSLRNVEVVEG